LFEEDDKKLAALANIYKKGELLSRGLKKYAIEKINAFLAEHQKRRAKAEKLLPQFMLKV